MLDETDVYDLNSKVLKWHVKAWKSSKHLFMYGDDLLNLLLKM